MINPQAVPSVHLWSPGACCCRPGIWGRISDSRDFLSFVPGGAPAEPPPPAGGCGFVQFSAPMIDPNSGSPPWGPKGVGGPPGPKKFSGSGVVCALAHLPAGLAPEGQKWPFSTKPTSWRGCACYGRHPIAQRTPCCCLLPVSVCLPSWVVQVLQEQTGDDEEARATVPEHRACVPPVA